MGNTLPIFGFAMKLVVLLMELFLPVMAGITFLNLEITTVRMVVLFIIVLKWVQMRMLAFQMPIAYLLSLGLW